MVSYYRFLAGYVVLRISGDNPEKFINLCTLRGISVWDIKRKKDSIMLNIGVKEFKTVRKIKQQLGSDIRIKLINKCGMPFICKQKFKRLGVIIGIMIFTLINIIMSQFIWLIEVEGISKISKTEIVEACEKLNIKEGCYRRSIDTYNAAQKLALIFEDIAWVSVNIEGCKVTVNVSEAKISEQNENTPSNIVADIDGVIKKLEIVSGTKIASVNQAVRKGDLLVSGVVEYGEKSYLLRSQGSVIAQTQRSFSKKIDKNYSYTVDTGDTKTRMVFEFFGIKIPLYLQKIYEGSNSVFQQNRFRLFGNEIPIGTAKREFFITEKYRKKLTSIDAENLTVNSIFQELKELNALQVINKNVRVTETNNYFLVEVDLVCLEDICKYEDIDVTDD